MNTKICSKCGKGKVWKSGLCLNCIPKKPLKQGKSKLKSKNRLKNSLQPVLKRKRIKPISSKGLEKKELKKAKTKELHAWFLELWDKQEDNNGYCYCYETGTPMHRTSYRENLCVYSHILLKSKYPEYSMKDWNVKIVLPEQHALFEGRSKKAVKQMRLLDIYMKNINVLDNLDNLVV